MSILQNELKEYDNLREEINQKIELHNKLLTFTITTVIAILTFAISKNNSFLYLMPLGVILPMSMRIAYYRIAMAKLSSYMIVFLEDHIEGLKWETRNTIVIEDSVSISKIIKNRKPLNILPYYECLVLSFLCYILYLTSYMKGRTFQFVTVFNALWPIVFLLIECIITYRINSIDKKKIEWINRWQIIKNMEKK